MPEPLPPEFADALAATAARRGPFGTPIFYFAETTSTNDIAATLADGGAPEGTTVLASAQTAGRGRLGRHWYSPPGAGLYFSTVVRDAAVAPYVTLAGGVAVADAVRGATGLPVEIKWPNDVVAPAGSASKQRRKLAGVLAEASSAAEGLQFVVLGAGINLRPAAYPLEIAERSTSIETELGRAADGPSVFVETLVRLSALVKTLRRGDAASLLERWRQLAPTARGSLVKWDTPAGSLSGTAAGIDDRGALLVRVEDRVERIVAGEVTWL